MSHPEQTHFWEQGEVKRIDCGKSGRKWVPAFKKDLKYDGNSNCMHTKITEDKAEHIKQCTYIQKIHNDEW